MTKILRYLTVLTTLLLFVLPAQATLYSYITRSEGNRLLLPDYCLDSAAGGQRASLCESRSDKKMLRQY